MDIFVDIITHSDFVPLLFTLSCISLAACIWAWSALRGIWYSFDSVLQWRPLGLCCKCWLWIFVLQKMLLTWRAEHVWHYNVLDWNWVCVEFNLIIWGFGADFLGKLFSIALNSLCIRILIKESKLLELLGVQYLGKNVNFWLALLIVISNTEAWFFSILYRFLRRFSFLDLLVMLY